MSLTLPASEDGAAPTLYYDGPDGSASNVRFAYSADSGVWAATIPAADTEKLPPGSYRAEAWRTTDEGETRLQTWVFKVTPSLRAGPASADEKDPRSFPEKMADALKDAALRLAEGDAVTGVSVEGLDVSFQNATELRLLIKNYERDARDLKVAEEVGIVRTVGLG